MSNIEIGQRRRDGKYPVAMTFGGGANAFGGHYPSKTFKKLYMLEKVIALVTDSGNEAQRAKFLPIATQEVA